MTHNWEFSHFSSIHFAIACIRIFQMKHFKFLITNTLIYSREAWPHTQQFLRSYLVGVTFCCCPQSHGSKLTLTLWGSLAMALPSLGSVMEPTHTHQVLTPHSLLHSTPVCLAPTVCQALCWARTWDKSQVYLYLYHWGELNRL